MAEDNLTASEQFSVICDSLTADDIQNPKDDLEGIMAINDYYNKCQIEDRILLNKNRHLRFIG